MFKGWIGEKKTEYKLLFSLDSDVYTVYHNIIIPSRNGTTQIDHVIISPFGLFVVETKNLKGWIYGTETQSTWTQVVYQSKYKFQNPLRQSYRHKKVLSKHLRIKESYIYQVVSFVGDCQSWIICFDGSAIINGKVMEKFDYAKLEEKNYEVEVGDSLLGVFTKL